MMPEELIPIILFVCLFAFLSVTVLAKMVTKIYRTRATLNFIDRLFERGFSVAEIERILKMCQGMTETSLDMEQLSSRVNRPMPPVKQTVPY